MGTAGDYLLSAGQVLADTYRIERGIGKGGMGEVYEASHARLAGRYAVKLLLRDIGQSDELLARFKQEAEVTSRLRHPNIVQVIDFSRMPDGISPDGLHLRVEARAAVTGLGSRGLLARQSGVTPTARCAMRNVKASGSTPRCTSFRGLDTTR